MTIQLSLFLFFAHERVNRSKFKKIHKRSSDMKSVVKRVILVKVDMKHMIESVGSAE
jgi:hypothetical protein